MEHSAALWKLCALNVGLMKLISQSLMPRIFLLNAIARSNVTEKNQAFSALLSIKISLINALCHSSSLAFFLVWFQPKGKIDGPTEFTEALNHSDLKPDKRFELITSLRVALTNNPVR